MAGSLGGSCLGTVKDSDLYGQTNEIVISMGVYGYTAMCDGVIGMDA